MILSPYIPPCYYFYDSTKMFDSEENQLKDFIKDSKFYLLINLTGLIVIVIAAIWLLLAFQLLFGTVYLMTFSFPLLLAGTFINWKRINKAKEKLRG